MSSCDCHVIVKNYDESSVLVKYVWRAGSLLLSVRIHSSIAK